VYTGDLGLDDGIPVGVYTLDTSTLTEIAGRKAAEPTIKLAIGDRVELPNGLGSVELTEIPRFVSFDIHRDPAQGWVLAFAIAAVLGLLTSLFIPRRRVWVKVAGGRIEYAGLARGEDPTLDAAVAELAQKHARLLDEQGSAESARP
jgi:cytochrome c biogenesis protein